MSYGRKHKRRGNRRRRGSRNRNRTHRIPGNAGRVGYRL